MIWLQDRQNRRVRYLRLSVTDRCNLRCTYCMPEKMTFKPRREILDFEEIERIVRVFVSLGIDKVRVTGGEPLTRRGIVSLVGRIARIDGVNDLSMTTNGVLLAEHAQALADVGLRRVNVSLDTVNPVHFRELTRWGDVRPVLAGIEAAVAAGLAPVKINAVVLKDQSDQDLGEFVRFCRDRGLILRFIEYMPIGIDNHWTPERFLGIDAVRDVLTRQGFSIAPAEDARPIGGGPARYWHVTAPEGGAAAVVGFIAALSHNFCAMCNRVRLTADGRVRECLTHGGRLNLKAMLRAGATDDEVRVAVHGALYGKIDGHGFHPTDGGLRTAVTMSALGG